MHMMAYGDRRDAEAVAQIAGCTSVEEPMHEETMVQDLQQRAKDRADNNPA